MGRTRPQPSQTSKTPAEIEGSSKSPSSTRATRGAPKRSAPPGEVESHHRAPSTLQEFKLTNEACLRTYSSLKSLEEFTNAFPGNFQEKLARGALKANGGALPCFLCQKFLSSSSGLVLHIRKCRGATSTQAAEPPKPSRHQLIARRRLINAPTITSFEQLKGEPSLWLYIGDDQKLKLLKEYFPDERIDCFAIPKPGKTCPLLTSYKDAIAHLDSCIEPMYFTYIGERAAEFRKLDKKERSRYVREALSTHLQLPCLECGRLFGHRYGLLYHVERCNVSDEEMPWKCYRCGYVTTRSESCEHLRQCWIERDLLIAEEEMGNVMGALGDVNLRSGKSILKGANETITINGEAKPLSELSAKEALEALIGPENSLVMPKKRRSTTRASISAGVIPSSSARMSITGDGKMRFRFRKADVRAGVSGISEYPKYVENVKKAHEIWVQETAALPYCSRLLDIKPSVWKTTCKSARLPFISKESVGFRIRESEDKNSYQEVPQSCQRLPALSSVELKREIHDYVTIAYCGGPINTISVAPNAMPNGEEVVAVVTYPCESTLIGKDMKNSQGLVQFWLHSVDGLRSNIRPWFVLKSNFGLILTAHWLDRPKSSENDTLIGFVAVATAQGALLIYRLDTTTVSSTASDLKKLPVVEPEPSLILQQPKPWLSDDRTREENSEPQYPPPLISIAWCTRDEAQYIVAVNAAGGAVIWDLQRSLDAPYVLLDSSWCSPATHAAFICGFEVALSFRERLIRVYDVRTYQCVLEESTVRTAGCRATTQPRLFSGFFSCQSEYFVGTDPPNTGVSFICTDSKADGFFVVPLANRHEHMTWDVSASTQNAVVASCGLDGKVLLSTNGRLVTIANTVDFGFSLLKTALTIVRRRISEPEEESIQELVSKMETPQESEQPAEGADQPKRRASRSYATHEESLQNLWLDIFLNPDSKNLRTQRKLTSLDLRIESLNCVATNYRTRPFVFTGGQAGLMFIRPCVIDGESPLINELYHVPIESNEKPLGKSKKA
ncbi:hypothetical protein Aduo_002852 [Ancylostoma duodenale]